MTVNAILVADTLEVLLKVHAMREARGKALTEEMAQHIVKELKRKHPILASIIESAHPHTHNGYEGDYRCTHCC